METLLPIYSQRIRMITPANWRSASVTSWRSPRKLRARLASSWKSLASSWATSGWPVYRYTCVSVPHYTRVSVYHYTSVSVGRTLPVSVDQTKQGQVGVIKPPRLSGDWEVCEGLRPFRFAKRWKKIHTPPTPRSSGRTKRELNSVLWHIGNRNNAYIWCADCYIQERRTKIWNQWNYRSPCSTK